MNTYEKGLLATAGVCVLVIIFAVWAAYYSPTAKRLQACVVEQIESGRELDAAEYICKRRDL